MCGPEVTNRPRGGALAALASPFSSNAPRGIIRGDLAFHTPGSPGSGEATHARLTPGEACDMSELSDLRVVIHSSGDLTRSTQECGLFRQFSFPSGQPSYDQTFVELPLERPLSLEVGNEGIIGRRVSLCSRSSAGQDFVVAEGIVGFNFVSDAPPSL